MRLAPVVNFNRNFVNNAKYAQTQSVNKSLNSQNKSTHKYTGVPCADLAYASMFDSAIARDLKLMGLI